MADSGKTRGAFLALLSLEDGPKHGYEISNYIKERSAGFFSLSFGTLYPILHKLESEGLVAGDWKDVGPAKARKVYKLTAKGKRALAKEREAYQESAAAFSKLLGEKA